MTVADAFVRSLWDLLKEYDRNKAAGLAPKVLQYFEIWRGLHKEAINISVEGWIALENAAKGLNIQVSGSGKKLDLEYFLFALETYLETLMKMILLVRKGQTVKEISQLRSAFGGIRGLIEDDLFEWFIDAYFHPGLSPSLRDSLEQSFKMVSSVLSILDLGRIDFDLFRDIYQQIISKELRRSLGEFYTEETLVKEVLDSCGLNAQALFSLFDEWKKYGLGDAIPGRNGGSAIIVLDPTCGSGTFLIEVLSRIVDTLKPTGVDEAHICRFITDVLMGIDINPFAVYMAKLNILLRMSEKLPSCQPVKVNVVWGDSLTRQMSGATPASGKPTVRIYVPVLSAFVTTGAYYLELPDPTEFMPLEELLQTVSDRVEDGQSLQDIENHLRDKGGKVAQNFTDYEYLLKPVYETVKAIYDRGNSRLFRLLMNVVRVAGLRGTCRYVVGNPPWVRAREIDRKIMNYLRGGYKDYKGYDVFDPSKTYKPKFTKTRVPFTVQFDYSMAFVEAGLGYLVEGGCLGYVITSKIAQTTYAGQLRHILLMKSTLLKLVDYSLYERPLFRDAMNYPLVLAVRKQEPIAGVYSVGIDVINTAGNRKTFMLLQRELLLDTNDTRSPWVIAPHDALVAFRKMQTSGPRMGSLYAINMGVKTSANELYIVRRLISIASRLADVELEDGSRATVEKDLLKPMLRGDDIDPFDFGVSFLILFPHKANGDALSDPDQRMLMGILSSHRGIVQETSFSGTTLVYGFRVAAEDMVQSLQSSMSGKFTLVSRPHGGAVKASWDVKKGEDRVLGISIEDCSKGRRYFTKVYVEGLAIPEMSHATSHFLNHLKLLLKRDDYKTGQMPWMIFRVSKEKLTNKVAWQENAKTIEASPLPATYSCTFGTYKISGLLVPIQTVYFVAPNNLHEMVGLSLYLNSSLANAFMKLVAWRARGGYFRHTAVAMGNLPIPMKMNKLAGFIKAPKTTISNFKTWIGKLKDFSEKNTSRIDDLVRDLVGLTSQEATYLTDYSKWMNP